LEGSPDVRAEWGWDLKLRRAADHLDGIHAAADALISKADFKDTELTFYDPAEQWHSIRWNRVAPQPDPTWGTILGTTGPHLCAGVRDGGSRNRATHVARREPFI
jgi:hypothetical protein